MHACRNISAETFTARHEPAIGLKNAKKTTNTQLPESHCLATPRAIPAGIMRQTAPPNGPFGNAKWAIRQCNTARKTAKTSPYSNAICGSSDHAKRQMSQPTSAPLPKIHGTLSPQTIFRAFPFVLISKKNKATAEASLTSTENKKAAPPNCHATPHRHQPPPVHTAMATHNGSARHTTASERKTHRILFSIKPFIPTNVIPMTTVTTND